MREVEFRVMGVPVSAQAKSAAMKTRWRDEIQRAAKKAIGAAPLLRGDLCVHIRIFLDQELRPDIDNLEKPILDALQDIVFQNDNSVIDLDAKIRLLSEPFVIAGVSSVLTAGFEPYLPFVYIKVTDIVQREVI